VLHHVADPGEALAEVARSLAPGGRLLIVDLAPHDRLEFRDEMGHLWLGFSETQLGAWLSAAGFASWRLSPLAADREAPPAERRPPLFALTARRAEGAAVIQIPASPRTSAARTSPEIPDSQGA
jgi:ArsR family transcriptional regulator